MNNTIIIFGEKATLQNGKWVCRVREISDILNRSRNILPMTSVEEGDESEIQRVKLLFGAK